MNYIERLRTEIDGGIDYHVVEMASGCHLQYLFRSFGF